MEILLPILEQSSGFIIDKLADAAASYLKEQYFWKTNLEKEVNKLHNLLPQIQAVVDFAERKTITRNESLVKWLWQFRDGIDEAEEVLDDLEYIQLEKRANTDKTKLSKAADASIRFAKRVIEIDDVLKRLRKCAHNLSSNAQSVGDFFRLVKELDDSGCSKFYLKQQLPPIAGDRITTSLSGSTLFKGRETEKQMIIQTLMEESESNTWNVLVLPLVGMGGIGKTALAQQVYNHFKNVRHFDIRIWVCISTDFNVASLTKKIFESISDDRSDLENLDKLQTKIREILQIKKFLLVLDDAWDDRELGDWERLCAPLQYGQKGSRILLTTRSSSVVKMVSMAMGGTVKQMDLGGLPDGECRSLLFRYAFASEDPNVHPELTGVGEEIIVKLQGIPLVAKTIGGVLNSKLELEHWRSVLTNKLWEMPQNSREDFIPTLRISYSMLSARLKRCFAYCSLFPQDYTFQKKKLVNMWTAAGLIQPQQSEGLEDAFAGQCFDLLHAKSFFDVHPQKKDCYVMHDMLHGLACHVSRHEFCRITHDQAKDIPRTVRHLSILDTLDELLAQTMTAAKLRHLRTLFIRYNGHPQKLYNFLREVCTSSRSIRVLVIEFATFITLDSRWLKNIGNLINVRLIELSNCCVSRFLESLCKCYFLQVLDVRHLNGEFLENSSGMNKLINLKHFCTRDFAIFKVGKLTCLQELYAFPVRNRNGCRIDELKDMNDLRHLEIAHLRNVLSSKEAKSANLHMKRKLSSLILSWDKLPNGHSNLVHFDHQMLVGLDDLPSIKESTMEYENYQVLAALNPPPNIRELIIMYYRGGKSATWMSTSSLYHLQTLKVFSCPGWEELPPLWELPHLKHLYLKYMDAIRRFGPESSNSDPLFPSLEELMVNNLPNLQEWGGADDCIWFPHLRVLQVYVCPQLRKIPCLPLSLEVFDIAEVGLTSLPRSYKICNDSRTLGRFGELMSLRNSNIFSCSEILRRESTSAEVDGNLLPSSLMQLGIRDAHLDVLCNYYLQGLTMLSKLSLYSCGGVALTLDPTGHLTALKMVYLVSCNDLVSLGALRSLTSLRKLKIDNCPKLFDQ